MRTFSRIIVLLLLLGFVACNEQELVANLSDGDSIDALVMLDKSGIPARREKSSKGSSARYSLFVSEQDYIGALKVLREYGVTARDNESFEQLTQPEGMTPNLPSVSALRADRALAVQLERHLAALPGVVNVTAIVHSKQSSADTTFFPRSSAEKEDEGSASIIVRYSADGNDLPFDLDEMRRIAAGALPGLPLERIEITPVRVDLTAMGNSLGVDKAQGGKGYVLRQIAPFSFRIPEADTSTAVKQLLMVIILLACGFFVLGVGTGRKTARRKAKVSTTEPDPRGLERSFLGGERPGVEGEQGQKRIST